MAVSSARYDFTVQTKNIIAQRASFRCVVPGCDTQTVGPGAGRMDVANVGTASHIYSAAKKGPRGRAGLSEAQIKDPDNGVWCCAYHGRLIDTNAGDAYPAILLQSWKRLQEAQNRSRMDGQHTTVGWFDNMRVNQCFLFRPDTTLKFSKCTVIEGGAAGKTALLEWLSASMGSRIVNRWLSDPGRIITTLTYFAPEARNIEFAIVDGRPRLSLNGKSVAEPPRDASVVAVRENIWSQLREVEEDDAAIGAALGIEREVIRDLEDDIHRNGSTWGRDLSFAAEMEEIDEEELGDLPATMRPRPRRLIVLRNVDGVTFPGLSTSEQTIVIIEFAAALARARAAQGPTLLTLDGSGWNLDDGSLAFFAEFFETQPYQTVLTRPGGWSPKNVEPWANWGRFRLVKQREGSVLERHTW